MPQIRSSRRPDYLIIFSSLALVIFGLVMLASASSDLSKNKFDDSYYILKHQILYGFLPGVVGFFLASKFYYQRYKKMALILMLVSIAFLIMIFTPLGFKAGGADRWLQLGPLTFQPAELLKISFIIYMAAWLCNSEKRKKDFWSGFVPFLFISGIVSFLLIIQPSTSTVVILMAAALFIYFINGARIIHVISAVLIGIILFLSVSYFSAYRWERIMSFINPEQNVQGSSYHINQALIAIGSGGVSGVGYGQSTTKLHYLPEPIGDSIFAIVAEELGFIGSALLIVIFLVFVVRCLILSMKASDRFAQLLLAGFATIIAIQVFINIGAISGLIPLTGTPLPFISYGGTALAIYMTISGIIVNISKHI